MNAIVLYIFLGLLGICVLALIILTAELYGMDLATDKDCNNFIDWIRIQHRLNKEIAAELKAERAFLKANPLCRECLQQGKYRKATYCTKGENELIPACKEHYVSPIDQHRQEAEEMNKG